MRVEIERLRERSTVFKGLKAAGKIFCYISLCKKNKTSVNLLCFTDLFINFCVRFYINFDDLYFHSILQHIFFPALSASAVLSTKMATPMWVSIILVTCQHPTQATPTWEGPATVTMDIPPRCLDTHLDHMGACIPTLISNDTLTEPKGLVEVCSTVIL